MAGWTAAAAFLAASLAGQAVQAQAAPPLARGVETRERIDDRWRIRPLGEEPVELRAYRGKVLFINAWASWCTPCVREMASIERLAKLLADTDVAFLLVSVEGERSVRRHLRRYPVSLPVFLEEQRFPPAFGLRGVPMSWIIDREGRIVFRHFGAAAWDAPAVESLLRELAAADG